MVNAAVEGSSWWLANQSIVVTWSTAGGGIRLASVFDRLGGRTAPKPGETFTVTLADGRSVAGSAFRLTGAPTVTDLPAVPFAAGSTALRPGKQIVARLTSPNGATIVAWRAALRSGDDFVRQEVTIESGVGQAAVTEIAMAGAPRNPLAAGGLAPLLAGISRSITDVDEHLTLEGLRLVHELNR